MKTLEEINEEYIPKQKIKDRIKELQVCNYLVRSKGKCVNVQCEYRNCNGRDFKCRFYRTDNKVTIQELQQILGGVE